MNQSSVSTQCPYISFEGPIGVGKTTLSRAIAGHCGGVMFLERFEENPYLAEFYAAPKTWAFRMQTWFLAHRHEQLGGVASARSTLIVSDHSLLKDDVFAHVLLSDRDMSLYEKLRGRLASVPEPDIYVMLDAPNDVLLNRIARRGRPYEQSISAKYLDDLRAAYERRIRALPRERTYFIDTSSFSDEDHIAVSRVLSHIVERATESMQRRGAAEGLG